MNLGPIKRQSALESWYGISPKCPEEVYLTPGSEFWAECADRRARAGLISALIAIVVVTIIIIAALYMYDHGPLVLGLAGAVGVVLIGRLIFNTSLTKASEEAYHMDAIERIKFNHNINNETESELVDDKYGKRRVWKEEVFEKIKDMKEELRKDMRDRGAEKGKSTSISMSQGNSGSATAPTAASAQDWKAEGVKGLFSLFKK